VLVIPSGVNDIGLSYSVYPNPSNDLFTVELSWVPTSTMNVVVSNIIGEVVLVAQITESKFIINLGNLPDGVYHLTMYTDDKILNETLIKEK
jgi:hypothetical protein